MIKVSGVSKSFNGQTVLKDLSLQVPDGQLLAILGESGSGKSVLLQHLIGLKKPDRGAVEINGVDITRLSEKELLKIRRSIGYLFQEGALYDFMTVRDNVAFPLVEHTELKPQEIREKVNRMLDLVGLKEAGGKFPSELSGGMKKRAALARAIIMDSKILFCDEPTSGLDPIKSREITDLIKAVAGEIHCTTVMASHDIANSFRIADRIVMIREGRIVADGNPQQLRAAKDEFVREFLAA